MGKTIELSPEYGLNPAITICFWCGRETGVALTGRIRNGVMGGDFKAPELVFGGYEPCPECQKNMELGVAFIEAELHPCFEGQPEIQSGVYPTGRWVVIKKGAAEKHFGCKSDKAFCDKQVFDDLLSSLKN